MVAIPESWQYVPYMFSSLVSAIALRAPEAAIPPAPLDSCISGMGA
ncbi:hypothetical protein [Sphingobium sp. CAP-1]|nr:hypothetical protein [Sphingobium sp. CAP-1]QGP79239.1 hypothetical protein GL174_09755 [Sphingobium sp. CAP-1]